MLAPALALPGVTTATSNTHEYQEAGFAWQGFAGLHVRLAKYIAIFTEFKLSYADMHLDLPNGSLEIQPWSEHLVLGLSLTLGKPNRR